MDIRNLVTFIHVAERNSFTKAAKELGYSQSTVSFQIQQLEAELNVQLFDRINRTVALTKRGREVLKYAHQISKLTRELEEGMHREEQVTGHVRLAVPDSLCESLLREGFADFQSRYPGITLQIIATGTEEMFRLFSFWTASLKAIVAKAKKAGVVMTDAGQSYLSCRICDCQRRKGSDAFCSGRSSSSVSEKKTQDPGIGGRAFCVDRERDELSEADG